MPAYVINDMEITDPGLFEEYKKLSAATVARYGGRFLARGGCIEALEGDWSPKRVVILEFPSMVQAQAWSDSPEYAGQAAAPDVSKVQPGDDRGLRSRLTCRFRSSSASCPAFCAGRLFFG